MPLPKINTPIYELTLPSTGKKIRYRPFLVKEEKVLIIALESEDTKQITNAIKNVISNCILSRGVKVENLSTFDIEYLFLNIRGKSVGEEVEVMVTCPDDNETKVPVIIPLDEIKIFQDPKHSRDIDLDDKLKMRMKYPSLSEFVKNNFDVDDMGMKESFELISSCIEQVFNDEESWSASDCSKKELNEFIEQLNSQQFKKVENFFETMPKLSYTVKFKNPKTGVNNEVVLEGLSDFFE
jgi:citrate lyase gamma subunit|tara:strand:- start:1624 stop:2340 length:717 start_codon:yes stop_codon:yes gene_type:complete